MFLSLEQVREVGHLARLQLNEADLNQLVQDLNRILDYFVALNEVDTSSVLPLAHPLELANQLREDNLGPSLAVEDALANAPESKAHYFQIPPVFE